MDKSFSSILLQTFDIFHSSSYIDRLLIGDEPYLSNASALYIRYTSYKTLAEFECDCATK
jgi:hypothetical protein